MASYQPIGKGWEIKYAIRNDDIWRNYWVNNSYTNTTITQQTYEIQTATWHSWNNGDHWYIRDEEIARVNTIADRHGGPYVYNWTPYTHPLQEATWERWHVQERETREQEQSRRRLEMEAAREAQIAERAAAHERGMELLHMILSEEERLLLLQTGKIHVRGSAGGLYEILTNDYGVHGNIHEVDEHGCKLANLCVAPSMRIDGGVLPLSDGYVGQYLAVKHDEAGLRAKANFSMRRTCAQPDVPILGAGQRAA